MKTKQNKGILLSWWQVHRIISNSYSNSLTKVMTVFIFPTDLQDHSVIDYYFYNTI